MERTKLRWEHREKANTPREAMEALADWLTQDHIIDTAIYVGPTGNELQEVTDYADRWNIPFDPQLFVDVVKNLDNKHHSDTSYWTVSSAIC